MNQSEPAEVNLIIPQNRDERLKLVQKMMAEGNSLTAIARALNVKPVRINYILDPHKHYARMKLHRAVKSKKIIKPLLCSRCGQIPKRMEAHHPDYDKALDVVWLCTKCHNLEHIGDPVRLRPNIKTVIAGKYKYRRWCELCDFRVYSKAHKESCAYFAALKSKNLLDT